MSAEHSGPGRILHRSYLYAPGSSPAVMAKALAAGADAVVLDLEDAVAPAEKATARRQVAAVLSDAGGQGGSDVHVRINRDGSSWSVEDLHAVVGPGLGALRLPKVDAGGAIRELDVQLAALEQAAGIPQGSVGVYPIIESVAGVTVAVEVLGASDRIARAAFGASDFLADIGAVGDDDLATLHVRSTLVLASRTAGVGPPIDSVHTDLDDEDGLRREAARARALGFFGKSVIHPRQLPVVHEVFTPTDTQLAWAQEVIAVTERAAAGTVDGQFVDAAVAARARAVLDLEEQIRGRG